MVRRLFMCEQLWNCRFCRKPGSSCLWQPQRQQAVATRVPTSKEKVQRKKLRIINIEITYWLKRDITQTLKTTTTNHFPSSAHHSDHHYKALQNPSSPVHLANISQNFPQKYTYWYIDLQSHSSHLVLLSCSNFPRYHVHRRLVRREFRRLRIVFLWLRGILGRHLGQSRCSDRQGVFGIERTLGGCHGEGMIFGWGDGQLFKEG